MNILALRRLADKDLMQDLQSAGVTNLNADIQAALKESLEEETRAQAKAAAQEILRLVRQGNAQIEATVIRTRELRAEQRRVQAERDAIKRAISYGNTTSNFLPLAKLAGQVGTSDLRESPHLFEVPADWQDPADIKTDSAE